MINESVRVIKIASSSRLSDRYLTVQIKDAPEIEQESVSGRLFGLVEIEGSWQSNAQIGQTIINAAARQYFRGTETTPLSNFEAALKRVNETLKQATHIGTTEWIGHLHAALIVIIGNEIHLATTGHVYAMLFREDQATPMLEESPEIPVVPNKIFGTLLSGTIEPGDRLLIASTGLTKLLAQAEINQALATANTLTDATTRLSTLLRAKRGRWVNAFLVDATKPTENEHQAETVLLEGNGKLDWRSGSAQLIISSQRLIQPAWHWLKQTTQNTQQFVKNKLIPQSKEGIENTKSWSSKQLEQLQHNTIPKMKEQSQPAWLKLKESLLSLARLKSTPKKPGLEIIAPATAKPTVLPITENLIGRSVYAIRDYSELKEPTPSEVQPIISSYDQAEVVGTHTTRSKLSLNALKPLLKKFEWRSIVFGLIAVILIIILLTNIRIITRQRQNEQSKQQLTTQLSHLQDRLEEAKLARVFNQPDKATAALQEVLAGLPALLKSSVADGASQLQKKAQGELDALTQTTRITTLKKIAHVDGAARFVRSGGLAALTDIHGSLIGTILLSDGSVKPTSLPSNQQTTALSSYDGKDGIVLLTNQPNVFELTTNNLTPSELKTSGNWKTGTALASFFNNLYVLSVTDNQIWKYTSVQQSFGAAEKFITDGTSMTGAIDLAIDGQVYILKDDGTIIRISRGKADPLTLTPPPAPTNLITKAKQIATTRESSKLYLLDDARILAFDKSGHFQSQYAFADINAIDSFAIDELQKTVFILSGGTLYSAPL